MNILKYYTLILMIVSLIRSLYNIKLGSDEE